MHTLLLFMLILIVGTPAYANDKENCAPQNMLPKDNAIAVAIDAVKARTKDFSLDAFRFDAEHDGCGWIVSFERKGRGLGRYGEVVISAQGKVLHYVGGM